MTGSKMLRYAPLIGLIAPTLCWWFVAMDLTSPFSGWLERMMWLTLTMFSGYMGLSLMVLVSFGLAGAAIAFMRERHGPDWGGVFYMSAASIGMFGSAYLIAKGLGL